MAAALYRISNDPELRHRMGEEGRAKAPEYSWDRVTEQIVDFYREIREQVAVSSGGRR
jgi:glycosyltransferase involved in cell wall biosynthesis